MKEIKPNTKTRNTKSIKLIDKMSNPVQLNGKYGMRGYITNKDLMVAVTFLKYNEG